MIIALTLTLMAHGSVATRQSAGSSSSSMLVGTSQYTDCNGTINGDAYYDDCRRCSGGHTWHIPNSDIDCDDNCNGRFQLTLFNDTISATRLLPQCSCHSTSVYETLCDRTPAVSVYRHEASSLFLNRPMYIFYRRPAAAVAAAPHDSGVIWQTINISTWLRIKPFYYRLPLPFTLKYFTAYTRVIYILENGMIAMHGISSRTSPLTNQWITTCDVPAMSTLFQPPK